jgi:uncharacterized protein (DUF849 family)
VVLPVGRYQFALGTVAAVMNGNVRVGMEDNLYIRKGELMKSNEESVRKMRRMVEELNIEVAATDEVRQLLHLKGKRKTRFSA